VDLENLVTLRGNTHPLARPEFDQGAAPDSQPMERMLLVLQRSPEEESALRSLLDQQQIKSSPNYHMWLTPEQFGEQFGPADADIQAVTGWLTSQGFEVRRVAAGRTVIEFSGTAGAVRQAFHTEIHRYVVEGEEHWANASDPQIPAALEPVVAGFASLNNFPRRPMIQRVGAFSRSKATGVVKPLFTVSSSNGNYYALGPTDFATIYNVLPLWQATPAIDGTGQTIAIVAESNINVRDARDFRNVFGLPANDPQIILDGPDPGVLESGSESEADLDVEWAGAVAKNATIDLVVSQSTEATAGVDLSAVYIIDTNLAPVMSESFGYCEAFLGVGGNAFYQTTREQGAAQGITIVNSGGDSGSARCDQGMGEAAAQYGLAVSGMASTPFNVAVGGTDFNDVNNWSTYWSGANYSGTLSSALSYIPEMTWNDSCARSGQASSCVAPDLHTPVGIDLVAGGGGASNCVTSTSTGTSVTCTAGYPKPAWQSGTGVPNDRARDIPDVSLFASNGFNSSFYVMCEADALPGYISCNPAYDNWYFLGAGGTSAAAPAFAGIMALVNQKTGERQGNANYVLYALAAKSGASCTSSASMAASSSACIFHDVVTGNNSVACVGGSPNCSNTTSGGFGILEVNPPVNPSPAWTTTAGYDLATGLGSVNAANLVDNWTSVSFKPTTTTLPNLSPTTLTHGQSVNFTVNVAPSSGSGTPTGDVSLIAQAGSSSSNVTGIGSFPLSMGSSSSSFSGTTNMLPGGSYGVTAHYAGDGTFGASDSTPPLQVTVNAEGSQTHVALLTFNPATGQETSSNATSVVYGSSFNILRADVTNSSGQLCSSSSYPCPTGQVTLTDNGQIDLGAYKLNSQGYAEDQLVQPAGGSHKVVASYWGDNSYIASTSPTDTITITPGPTTTTLPGLPSSSVGGNVNFSVTINTQSYGVAPTGTVQLLNNGAPLGPPTFANGTPYLPSTGAYATGTAPIYASLPLGTDNITVQYSGDSNYAGSTSAAATITVTDFSVTLNPSTISIPAPGQSGTATITITPLGGFAGSMDVACYVPGWTWGIKCSVSPEYLTVTASSAATTTLTITTVGANSLTAPTPQLRIPPSPRLLVGWPWLLAGLLALATLLSLATARRHQAAWLFATALLVVGVWAACGGGGGGGGGGSPPQAPDVSLSPGSLTFSQQNTGTTSAAQSVLLSNIGNAFLSISSIAIGGTDPGDFAQTNNCGSSVGPGGVCSISVTFTPTAAGSRSASVAITDNASGSPQTVSLTGTGVQPVVTFSPSSLTFGPEGVGLTTPPQTVTLLNTGNSSVTISGIYTSSAEFPETNNCPSSVAAGANCTISVTFVPSETGARNALLSVLYNSIGSPMTASLTGTGITAPGTYALTVEATSGSDSHSVPLSVTVQ
jgi:subtilase family serine protease